MSDRYCGKPRLILSAAALVLALACTSEEAKVDKTAASGTPLAQRPASDGWLEWLATDAEGLKPFEEKKGWTSYYQRKYRESIQAFRAGGADPTADLDRVGLARVHFDLAQLNLALTSLLAKTEVEYFDGRAKLGESVPKLRSAAYYRGAALAFVRPNDAASAFEETKDASKSQQRLAASLQKSCAELSAKPADAWTVVAAFVKCDLEKQPPPACPKVQVAPPAELDEAWKARVAGYYSAVCEDTSKLEEAALLELARTPAESETTSKVTVGTTEVQGTIAYYDVVAQWALARYHLRRAESLFSNPRAPEPAFLAHVRALMGDPSKSGAAAATAEQVAAEYLVFSSWRDAADLHRALAGGDEELGSAEEILAKANAISTELTAKLDSSPNAGARDVVRKLSLEPSYVDAFVRRRASTALRKQECALALRLLRTTQDLKTGQEISYRNAPIFFADSAAGSLCMRRTTDAIGALRVLRTSNPEVEGLFATVNSLGNLESVGKGTGGEKHED